MFVKLYKAIYNKDIIQMCGVLNIITVITHSI